MLILTTIDLIWLNVMLPTSPDSDWTSPRSSHNVVTSFPRELSHWAALIYFVTFVASYCEPLKAAHTHIDNERIILALSRRTALLQAVLQLRRWPHAAKLLAGSANYDLRIVSSCHYSNEPLLVARNTWLRWHRSILALSRRIALLQALCYSFVYDLMRQSCLLAAQHKTFIYCQVVTIAMSRF